MVTLLNTVLSIMSGIAITGISACKSELLDKRSNLKACLKLADKVNNLQIESTIQINLYKALSTKVRGSYNLGLRFPNEILQSLASMRKMHLNYYDLNLFSIEEVMALELAIISPTTKAGILDSIKAIRQELCEEACIGVSMIKNLVEHPEYDIVLLKFMILVLEIHKLVEPIQTKKIIQLIPQIMYAHPDPVLHDFKTNKSEYHGLIQKYQAMLDESAFCVDFLLKLSLSDFPNHMNKEFLVRSFFQCLLFSSNRSSKIRQDKVLKILDYLNLVGNKYSVLFVHLLFKMPGFMGACEDPLFRQKLLQKLAPTLINSGIMSRNLEEIKEKYKVILPIPLKKMEPIVLPENGKWLEGQRKYRQSLLEGASSERVGVAPNFNSESTKLVTNNPVVPPNPITVSSPVLQSRTSSQSFDRPYEEIPSTPTAKATEEATESEFSSACAQSNIEVPLEGAIQSESGKPDM